MVATLKILNLSLNCLLIQAPEIERVWSIVFNSLFSMWLQVISIREGFSLWFFLLIYCLEAELIAENARILKWLFLRRLCPANWTLINVSNVLVLGASGHLYHISATEVRQTLDGETVPSDFVNLAISLILPNEAWLAHGAVLMWKFVQIAHVVDIFHHWRHTFRSWRWRLIELFHFHCLNFSLRFLFRHLSWLQCSLALLGVQIITLTINTGACLPFLFVLYPIKHGWLRTVARSRTSPFDDRVILSSNMNIQNHGILLSVINVATSWPTSVFLFHSGWIPTSWYSSLRHHGHMWLSLFLFIFTSRVLRYTWIRSNCLYLTLCVVLALH